MGETFDIYTLLFLVLAVVIFLRLRNVLGRRTGSERPPYDPYSRQESNSGPGSHSGGDTVVPMPRGRTGAGGFPRAVSQDVIDERIKGHATKGSKLAGALGSLVQTDPGFDPGHFVDGAKQAYEMIVIAFAEGDKKTLKQLLASDVYDGFVQAINAREGRGESVDSSFVGIDKAKIVEAELHDRKAQITVKFLSQLITATRDSDGNIIDGDPKKVHEVTDIWTFSRELASRDPNWKLVATEAET